MRNIDLIVATAVHLFKDLLIMDTWLVDDVYICARSHAVDAKIELH